MLLAEMSRSNVLDTDARGVKGKNNGKSTPSVCGRRVVLGMEKILRKDPSTIG